MGNLEMPQEYFGKETSPCGYTKTKPRRWTSKEIKWIQKKKIEGYNNSEIALATGRTEVSISIKLKRIGKMDKSYNKNHVKEKYQANEDFLKEISPETILDLYAGEKSFYNNKAKVTSNDINKESDTDYNMGALKLICKLFSENKKYDLIDLDPFGSAFDCFDLAIKMAKKGLVITLGEMGHKRFNRLDYVERYYGISDAEEFTSDNIINKIIQIGRRNKKELKVYKKFDWNGISRVYFKINKLLITSQWEK